MKKLMTIGVFVFAFAMTANFAFADWHMPSMPSATITNTNRANVNNKVITVTNTGLNATGSAMTSRHSSHIGGSITSGDAQALADVQTSANDTTINADIPAKSNLNVSNRNSACVNNMVVTVANSGINKVGNGTIATGFAASGASVVTVTNAAVIRMK